MNIGRADVWPKASLVRWGTASGMAGGLLVWANDHDFFLNPGGPATPISDAIGRAFGLAEAHWLILVFWPAAVLLAVGGTAGCCLGIVFSRILGK